MTKQEFMDAVNGAPIDLEEVANMAKKVTNSKDIREAGADYLCAYDNLRDLLSELEIELG